MASVDSLSILITASTASATTKIQALTKALTEMATAINALDVSKFERLSAATGELSQSFSNLKGLGVKEIKAIAKATQGLSDQKKSLDPVAKAAENVAEKVQKATENTDKIADGLAKVDTSSLDAMASAMNNVDRSVKDTRSSMELLASLFKKTKIEIPVDGIEKGAKRIQKLSEKIEDLQEKLEFKSQRDPDYVNSEDIEKDREKIAGLINELDRLKLKQQEMMRYGSPKLNIGEAVTNLRKGFTAVNKKIDEFVAKIRKTKAHTRDSAKATDSFSLASMKLAKELTRVTKMLKLMVTRMVLRKVIQNTIDGFKNLVQYSNETNAAVSMLWNSFRQLGNSVAAAASPLLNALAPVLNYLIQLCIKLVNAINQVISALLGKSTWTRAKKLSDDYGASLDKSNKSAKDLKRTILGFDEINQLQDNKDSGSGGGMTNPADMFEDAKIESKWKNLADKLKKILNQLLAPIKKAWANVGDQVVAAWTRAFNAVKKLLSDIGRDFLKVWNQPETIRMLENILRIFRDIGSIIALLAENLDKAWNKNKTGLKILEAIRDIFAIVIQHVKNMTSATVLWAKELDFTPLLNAFKDWVISMKPVVDAIAGAFEDFYRKVLLPLGKWTLEKGLPDLIDVFKRFNEEVEWDTIRARLNRVWEALEPFAETVGEGLTLFISRVSDKIAGFLNSEGWDDFIDTLVKWTNEVDADAVARGLSNIFTALAAYKTVDVLTTIVEKVTKLSDISKSGISIAIKIAIIFSVAQWIFDKAIGFLEWIDKIAMEEAGYTKVQIDVELAWWAKMREEYGSAGGIGRLLMDWLTGDHKKKSERWDIEAKVETLGVQEASIELEDLRGKADNLKNSDGIQMFVEKANGSIEQLKNINTVNFDPLKSSVNDAGKSVDNLAITVEKDSSAITKSANSIKFTPASTGASNLQKNVTKAFDGMATSVNKDATSITKSVENIKLTPLSDSSEDLRKKVTDNFGEIDKSVQGTSEVMTENMEQMTLAVSDGATALEETTDIIKESFTRDKWTFDGVVDGLRDTFRRAREAVENEWNKLAQDLNGNHQFGAASMNIHLPTFASGGFPEDGWFRASHGEMLGQFDNGQSVVANNEQIVDGIRQGVYEAVSMAMSTGQGGASYINNTIQVDGETIARAVTKGQRSIDRRYSPTMA